jgi:hypothetical protein
MPLGEFRDAAGQTVSNFGSNANGAASVEYCVTCFTGGAFTRPGLTMERMISMSIENMTGEQKIPEDRAREMAHRIIPTLRRWAGKE